MSHASPLSPSPVSRVPRFARTRITGILFRVQRYSRYSSPLRNGKDGTGRGGSGELVIKEGELGCVPFRGRPVRLKLSNFTPRVPSYLPWLPAMLVVCPTDSLRWCRNSFFECYAFVSAIIYDRSWLCQRKTWNFGIHIRKFRSVCSKRLLNRDRLLQFDSLEWSFQLPMEFSLY